MAEQNKGAASRLLASKGEDARRARRPVQSTYVSNDAEDPDWGSIIWNAIQAAADEASGAFERYGRRSGAQRDASLAMLNQAVDPNTDPLTGAGMKALGLAGLVTHPLAFFPTGDEWRERTRNAGNTGRMGQAIGGMLGDLPSIVDPHLLAGGGALAMAPLAAKMMNKADDAADAGIIAYHGSPHSFDKFDMSKIGTGEGAQAYGHGLYFAEAEDVAKTYKAAGPAANQHYDKINKRLSELAKEMDAIAIPGQYRQFRDKERGGALADEYDLLMEAKRNVGNTYQVKINVKPHELLDWDKPLSEQPESVRGILKGQPEVQRKIDAMRRIVGDKAENMSGQSAYAALTGWKQGADLSPTGEAAVATSQKLKAAGIKGIRYKDAGSRGSEGGTYNYVVFDDKLITILKKYGIPMTAGAGGAMMVAGQDMPPDIASQMGGT